MKREGLTLMELLFIMVILVALASVAVAVYHLATERARRVECMNNLRQIYLVMKMIEEDLGHMPETPWELFGVPPDHPVRKQHPNRQFYTGPWWRYIKVNTPFICPSVRVSEAWGVWYDPNDTMIMSRGTTYGFPNLTVGSFVKKGGVRREPKTPPPNATLVCCGGTSDTGRVIFHNLAVDFSGRIGKRYTPPELYQLVFDLRPDRGNVPLSYTVGWDLVK